VLATGRCFGFRTGRLREVTLPRQRKRFEKESGDELDSANLRTNCTARYVLCTSPQRPFGAIRRVRDAIIPTNIWSYEAVLIFQT
jgi:hypothetical protein